MFGRFDTPDGSDAVRDRDGRPMWLVRLSFIFVLQLIAAALIVIAWPKKWQFKSAPPQAVSAQQPV